MIIKNKFLISVVIVLASLIAVQACHGPPKITIPAGSIATAIHFQSQPLGAQKTVYLVMSNVQLIYVTAPVTNSDATYTEYTLVENAKMPKGYKGQDISTIAIESGIFSWEAFGEQSTSKNSGPEIVSEERLKMVDYVLAVPIGNMGNLKGNTLNLENAFIYPLPGPYECAISNLAMCPAPSGNTQVIVVDPEPTKVVIFSKGNPTKADPKNVQLIPLWPFDMLARSIVFISKA